MESHCSIQFLGAAGTVTGSKTLLEFDAQKILVDCGLFQGLKTLRRLNWQPFPINPSLINSVIITHAHLDHVGYVPLLVKHGFKGTIYATPPTCDLAKIILKDSAKLQEEEAYLANKGGYAKHTPAEPLYTLKDAEESLKHFVPVEDEKWNPLTEDFTFRFLKSGHILGSAFIEIMFKDKKIVFSGDLEDQILFCSTRQQKFLKRIILFLNQPTETKITPKARPKTNLQKLWMMH